MGAGATRQQGGGDSVPVIVPTHNWFLERLMRPAPQAQRQPNEHLAWKVLQQCPAVPWVCGVWIASKTRRFRWVGTGGREAEQYY